MPKPPKPCIVRLPSGAGCPEYALPGKSRCEEHQRAAIENRDLSPGTTPAWRRARKQALDRDGHRCRACGKTQEQAKAESRSGKGLEVHHLRPGQSIRDETHSLKDLATLCRQCHLKTLRRRDKPKSWEEHIAKLRQQQLG